MADKKVEAFVGAVGTTSALLIGSAIFEPRPSSDGGARGTGRSGVKRAEKKRGIRRIRGKDGKPVPAYMWAKGDLANMHELLTRKNIDVYDAQGEEEETQHSDGVQSDKDDEKVPKKVLWFNYKENRKGGTYALGKSDVLQNIEKFFDQKDKTLFVLYYTGHGDKDGSWVFPVTKTVNSSGASHRESQGEEEVTTSRHDVSAVQQPEGAGPTLVETTVEIHEDNGSQPPDDGNTNSQDPKEIQTQREESFSSQNQLSGESADIEPSRTRSNTSSYVASLQAQCMQEQPSPSRKCNDYVTFEDVVNLWDGKKEEREDGDQCRLLMILDCCHAGRWVQKVNGERNAWEEEAKVPEFAKRRDICIQAACRPSETSSVSENQHGSVFTKAFVAAQSKGLPEKCILTFLDHFFVLNIVSFALSPLKDQFTPLSSIHASFGDFRFFDSFDDMRT